MGTDETGSTGDEVIHECGKREVEMGRRAIPGSPRNARYIDKDEDNFNSFIFNKKYFLDEIINESIRDKMTPKTDKELLKIYDNVLQYIDNPLSNYPAKINPEFQKIANLFNEPQTNLQIVSENDADFHLMEEYFNALTVGDDNPTIIIVKETENEYGGKWFCYLDLKIANWSSNDFNEPSAWIFCKNVFENMKLTESFGKLKT